jgi:Protein of unknown function (DUF3465)
MQKSHLVIVALVGALMFFVGRESMPRNVPSVMIGAPSVEAKVVERAIRVDAPVVNLPAKDLLADTKVAMPAKSASAVSPPSTEVTAAHADKAAESITSATSTDTLSMAVAQHQSNVQVVGQGVVSKLLPEDNKGSQHQRFILTVAGGNTILIAHNIDLAPRIDNLKEGDTVGFSGEYIWNQKGGLVHWTHHDPSGTHPIGWLEVAGKKYQ